MPLRLHYTLVISRCHAQAHTGHLCTGPACSNWAAWLQLARCTSSPTGPRAKPTTRVTNNCGPATRLDSTRAQSWPVGENKWDPIKLFDVVVVVAAAAVVVVLLLVAGAAGQRRAPNHHWLPGACSSILVHARACSRCAQVAARPLRLPFRPARQSKARACSRSPCFLFPIIGPQWSTPSGNMDTEVVGRQFLAYVCQNVSSGLVPGRTGWPLGGSAGLRATCATCATCATFATFATLQRQDGGGILAVETRVPSADLPYLLSLLLLLLLLFHSSGPPETSAGTS